MSKKPLLVLSLVVTFLLGCDNGSDDPAVSPVFEGDVQLSTQTQVDEFGANNYSRVTGSLSISQNVVGGSTSITDLSSLASLTEVDGDLVVFTNGVLQNLDGFNNINRIGGQLFVVDNPELRSLSALQSLDDLGGSLIVADNPQLVNLEGLNNLTVIRGNLSIGIDVGAASFGNESLNSITALSNLTAVAGNLILSGNAITDMSGLSNIAAVPGEIRISFNTQLTSLSGLENIETVGDQLYIAFNDQLPDIDGFEGLRTVGNNLNIASNAALSQVTGLSNLTTVASFLSFSFNPMLTQLENSFTSLESLQGLTIENSAFETINDFNQLTRVDFIRFFDNETLEAIGGFDQLGQTTSLSFEFNESLNSISGFPSLVQLGSFTIEQPTTVVEPAIDITAFSSLSIVENNLIIEATSNSRVDFLGSVNVVGGDLRIRNNEQLADLCGLTTLVTNGSPMGDYNLFGNAYNPTRDDILKGNCSQ